MEVVNLTQSRKRYSDIEIIQMVNGNVFFAVQTHENGESFYQVKKYVIQEKHEEIIWQYKIEADTFYTQKAYMCQNKIIIVKLEEKGQVGVVILDTIKGEFVRETSIAIGSSEGEEIIAINERYFLVSGENSKFENIYYLCDIEEASSYLVTMVKFAGGLPAGHGLIRQLPCFKRQEEEWIVFNECYMEDYEYEQIYDGIIAKNFEASQIREIEALYVMPLETLITSIKQQKSIMPFTEIKRRWINGWVRYLGIKSGNIYYREKDFDTQMERIYAVNMESLEEDSVCQINHQELEGALRYNLEQVYEDIKSEAGRYVKGHYGLEATVEIPIDKRLRFEGYIENRYIITSWWWENEIEGNYEYKEFVGIRDTLAKEKEEEMLIYAGQCTIQDSVLLIY